MQIIINEPGDRAKLDQLMQLIEKAMAKEEATKSDKWLLTKDEIGKRLGWSETTIRKKIEEGKLTPIQDSNAQNAKVRFYVNEVLSNIPQSLIKKYGTPC